MGHIRLGRLPRTRSWSGVFGVLEAESIGPAELARAVSEAAHWEFSALKGDRAVSYCFWVLVRLVTAARANNFAEQLEGLGIHVLPLTSGLEFVQHVSRIVGREARKRGRPTVFTAMAEICLREALTANIVEQSKTLFGSDLVEVQAACRGMSTRKRFGQIAEEFFARFMSRCIDYVADKEISNHVGTADPLGSPKDVLEFQRGLHRYCTESAKIVEQFAAGWFSKHNWESNNSIPEDAALAFTAYAFEKLQMALREGAA